MGPWVVVNVNCAQKNHCISMSITYICFCIDHSNMFDIDQRLYENIIFKVLRQLLEKVSNL